MTDKETISASFRDPSGFLFKKDGQLYRQVNYAYIENFDFLINSGLYQKLVDEKFLIPHEEVKNLEKDDRAYKIIKPVELKFISYPYEWCFSQLKDAALTTLKIQKLALEFGLSLKDSSAYNIQFKSGQPILIDTLSFEKYKEGQPWVAYRQFCQHFLAPLALMKYKDVRLGQLLKVYLDGLPLDLASSLLPFKTHFNFSLLLHIHFHARSQKKFADKKVNAGEQKFSRFNFFALLDSLESAVKSLNWQLPKTEWADYYDQTNYSAGAFEVKKKIVAEFLSEINPQMVWDLGANVGIFSRLAANQGSAVISFDIDPAAVEKNYLEGRKNNEKNILPLLMDLTNPSSGLGWKGTERMSFFERGPSDCILALALIHHLAISNNLPLENIARFFSEICSSLIIEFVPEDDSQVKRLLVVRQDIFDKYSRKNFEEEFGKYFSIKKSFPLKGSDRVLYLMLQKQ